MTSMRTRLALAAAAIVVTIAGVAAQKGEVGPKVEKTYGDGLPRDRDRIVFRDDQYPFWPLTPEQQAYASINGARMKQHVVNLAQDRAARSRRRATSGGAGCQARRPTRKAWPT